MTFAGKTILVTGAASGIGRACAELLASREADELIVTDIDAATLDEFDAGCRVRRLAGDVGSEAFWDKCEIGEIDHAIINAGVAGSGPIDNLDFSEWRRILSVNLDGAFLSLRAAFRSMRNGGSIVLVGSTAGIKPEVGTAAYGASKAGVIHLAKIAAKEAAPRGIRVNVIAPGGVETGIWDEVPMFARRVGEIGLSEAFAELASKASLLKRFAKPAEIAEQILFLLSDACATVTGSVFVSDGGHIL